MSAQATVVLVHGAFHGAWCWKYVERGLRAADVAVTCVELPGHGESREPLAGLAEELRYQASRAEGLSDPELAAGRSVIIMGDQNMPYRLLKRIMATCAESDYRNISLAVNSKPVTAEEVLLLANRGD